MIPQKLNRRKRPCNCIDTPVPARSKTAETFKLYDKLGSWEAKEAQMQKQIRDLVVTKCACIYNDYSASDTANIETG